MHLENHFGELDYWLALSQKEAGLDIDSYVYTWRQLMILFNAQYFFGIKELEEKNGGYHVILNHPSSFEIRRGLGDDKNRVKSAELRQSVGIEFQTDILFSRKKRVRLVRGKDGRWKKFFKKAERYEAVPFESALNLPFWCRCPQEFKTAL